MRRFFCAFILAVGVARGAPTELSSNAKPLVAGWGLDGCLTCHVSYDGEFVAYVRLLKEAGVTWVRERGAWIDETTEGGRQLLSRLRTMREAGLHVVAFAGSPETRVVQAGNQLPEDLQAVYAGAFRQGRNTAGLVDAWEMSGEPDVGYCQDLPDRLAAYNKAMYWGLHDGAAAAGKTTIVLMGALALPPGPWLERAMRNDLLDCTDAYNFHFYGYARDLPGVIAAHRALLRATFPPSGLAARHGRPGAMFPESHGARPHTALPMWITECGINAVAPDNFYNPQRRAFQAAFARDTTQAARAASDVALFMPFILVHDDDPHAMTVRADFPLPAWEAYADYVRGHAWPQRPLVRAEAAPSRIVVQWMPDNATTVPHKVAGTYRFVADGPVRGVLRVYNFGDKPARGLIEAGVLPHVKIVSPAFAAAGGGRLQSAELLVAAGGRMDVPVEFSPAADGYFRDEWAAVFAGEGGRRSPVAFGLERWPEAKDFAGSPVVLKPARNVSLEGGETAGKPVGPWTPLNGLEVVSATMDGGVFQVERVSQDPLLPVAAVAAVDGLPAKGFLRLQQNRPMTPGVCVRVDLVDKKGQRFCIWENLGMNYARPSTDVWLGMEDFNVFFWGRCGANPRLRPEDVRQIKLRLFFAKANEPVEVKLSFMKEAMAVDGGR
jgi:hypothetical protein